MEIVKDIAAVLGVICSFSAVLTICSKSAKTFIGNIFKKYGNDDSMVKIEEKLNSINDKLDFIESLNAITVDFTREQCRGIIKDAFYKYYDTKTIPLYEHKYLLKIKDIYVGRLHGNSFAKELLDEMDSWDIDYSMANPKDDD